MRRLLLFAIVATLGLPLIAQQRTVTGRVTSAEDGSPIPGVTVLIKGTTSRGTATDGTGNYSIPVPQAGATLLFSFVGKIPQEIPVGTGNVINVVMKSSLVGLDEVVVVGYGTSKRSDLTGALSTVTGEKLRNTVTTNIDQALQGRVAGVQVTQNSGQPGGAASLRIRGSSSITGSSEPLYVIDAVPFQGDGQVVAGFDWAGGANGQNRVNPLSTINPADIVNIEILKDASATAIYGSRAANGVVLITTKHGRSGEAKISYNTFYAVQSLQKKLPMMDLPQFADYQLQISKDLDMTPNERYLDPSLLGPGTDWQNEVFRKAGIQSHQLSVTGGTDKTTYAISGGWFNQDGIIIGSSFDRFTTRMNLDSQLKKWLKVGGNLSYAKTNEKITLNDGGDGVIMQALSMQPDVAVKDMYGNYSGPDVSLGGVSYNPVAAALQRNNTLARERVMVNVYANATLMQGLDYRSEFGIDNNNSMNQAFHPTFKWGALINTENQMRQRVEKTFFWIWKNYLTYNLHFGEAHNLTAMVGTEAQRSDWEGIQITKKNFTSNDIQNLSQGDDKTSSTSGWKDAASLLSYFGRFNYNYADRYLATFTLRADGSSKFGPNNKWGYFPSGSFAWRISNEKFMEKADKISNLKLRVGYGLVGNQAIGTYLYGSSLITVKTPFGTAYRMEKISNPNLKWEATSQFNLGLDMSLFYGRVDLSVDLYNKQTKDMLLQLSIPSYLGGTGWDDISAPYANVGKMENKGVEITLLTRNIMREKFSWTTDFTFTLNRNLVKELDAADRVYWGSLYWYSEFQTVSMTAAGYPLGVFYGYQTEGIFTDQQDILNHAVQIVDPTSVSSETPKGKNLVNKTTGVWIGDIKFKDMNGDGVINTDDQTVIGDPNPDFSFGFNNTFSYGPFDLSIYLAGAYGYDILNYSRVVTEGMTSIYNNQSAAVDNRARIGLIDPNGSDLDPANVYLLNTDAALPRPTTTDNNRNNRMSDRFIEDGSYLRIQNVSLSYTLPNRWAQALKVDKLRVYVNGQNLLVLSNYSGYDPEIGAFNQNSRMQNIDMGRYPTPKMVSFGLDIEF
ncbi:MAG: TonB-dependent receptor [Bacteroidetes bacterium GWF2_49_14]|nr:MAG: TonB-dependent receptor [Bacteroidetes bacterium GWF2_49_14]HBB92853.1 TonB-dependent receptor [Bacteroidales bacterium]